MRCCQCLHDGVCYIQEVSNDIDEWLDEFGCDDFQDRTKWTEKKYGTWIWAKDHWECSVCRGSRFHDLVLGLDAAHCGHCGAKMIDKEDKYG
jgi:hypothetical protein